MLPFMLVKRVPLPTELVTSTAGTTYQHSSNIIVCVFGLAKDLREHNITTLLISWFHPNILPFTFDIPGEK